MSVCLFEILKSLNIVNLDRVMSTLKLKIIANLPQLSCFVVSAAHVQNGEFERFGGFCLTVTTRDKKETRLQSSFSTTPVPSRFSPRN